MKPSFRATVYRRYIALLVVPFLAAASVVGQSPAEAQQALAIQVALDRAGFSPGEIDGRIGAKTRQALAEFQKSSSLQPSGQANEETITALRMTDPLATYTITQQDAAGPFIERMPPDVMEAAKLPALGYTSSLEALAEKFHSSPALLRTLNPAATWTAEETIRVPAVDPLVIPAKGDKTEKTSRSAVEIVISGASHALSVRDLAGKVLMYAPVTVGSEKDPLPVGEWKVLGVSWNPVFNYNPDLFWDADPAHAKAKIPSGPNNPVGVVWIDISKEHFGLHGTPEPSTIGRTESHGCVRLTNWDAAKLARMVSPGTKVVIE